MEWNLAGAGFGCCCCFFGFVGVFVWRSARAEDGARQREYNGLNNNITQYGSTPLCHGHRHGTQDSMLLLLLNLPAPEVTERFAPS